MIIRFSDFREAGICASARFWFERHELDWKDFVRNGIDSSALLATEDHVQKIRELEQIAQRREEREDGRRRK